MVGRLRRYTRSQMGAISEVLENDARQAADLLTSLSAERDEAVNVFTAETIERGLQKARADRAEAERDALKAEKRELMRSGLALMVDLKTAKDECDLARETLDEFIAQSQRAENAELVALKARVAEVLEPFAKVAEHYEGWDDDVITASGWKVSRFRAVSALHATLTTPEPPTK